MNNGSLAGILNDEALIKYPGIFFNTLKIDEKYPNGESTIEFYDRIKNWLKNTIKSYNGEEESIVFATHSEVINIIYYIVNEI